MRSRTSALDSLKISGHKTRSTFDRYDIVSDADLEDASRKLEVAREVSEGRGRRCSGTGATHQYTVEYTVCYSEPNLNR